MTERDLDMSAGQARLGPASMQVENAATGPAATTAAAGQTRRHHRAQGGHQHRRLVGRDSILTHSQ